MPSSTPIFPLRMEPELKAGAAARAKRLGLSLNVYITKAVEAANAAIEPIPHHADRFKVGRVLEPMQAIARNAPCGCGSGKKFKRCCGR